jgi:hypothetical protein
MLWQLIRKIQWFITEGDLLITKIDNTSLQSKTLKKVLDIGRVRIYKQTFTIILVLRMPIFKNTSLP